MAGIFSEEIQEAVVFYPESPRALEAARYAGCFRKSRLAGSFAEAMEAAHALAGPGDWIIASGSFMVVSPALKYAYENYL